jgi:endonuclease G
MQIDPMELARIRLAQQKAVGRNLFDPVRKVNLVDIALNEGEDQVRYPLAIRYHVNRFIDEPMLESLGRVPLQKERIDGYPTKVIEGTYHPQQWFWDGNSWKPRSSPKANRANPLQGGISISTQYSGSGTLGGVVRDRSTGRPMLLSNWHVIVTYWGAPRGQSIVQPSRDDGGTSADVIATLDRDAMSSNLDAAVAYLNNSRRPSNSQLNIGTVSRPGVAILGLHVEKTGRSSGRTFGRITGIGGVQRLRYGWVERIIRSVITIEPRGGEVSRPGDSGSWWISSATREAVGLHFAGGNSPERALAIDMRTVLDALDVDIFS